MQDRTINSALQALRKQGGHQGKLAEVLLDMRGVPWSGITQDRPMRRGQTNSNQPRVSGALAAWG